MPDSRESPQQEVRRLVVGALQDPLGVPSLPPRELDLTLRALRRARLLGRLAADLQAAGRLDGLSPVIADQLCSALVVAESRARAARWELDRIAWALRARPEIPLVALKGCGYLLAGTPNARGRVFADVDLLVPEAELPEVEARLLQHGWQMAQMTPYDEHYYRAWAHELPPLMHPEREVEVDLHHRILMRTARLKPSSRRLFEASRTVPGSRFRVLAPEDMVLHAIAHLFYGGEMDDALRELVDIADLLRHFGDTAAGFWEQLGARSHALDLTGPANLGLRYAGKCLGAALPARAFAAGLAKQPMGPFLMVLDRLVPLALFPGAPGAASRSARQARLLLFGRSHWVKMPPGMLVRHLLHKFSERHRNRRGSSRIGV